MRDSSWLPYSAIAHDAGILGGSLRARDRDAQEVEARMACTILNRMAELGMPASCAIAE